MTRVLTHQASHTYGVLDPLVIERRDTKFVHASLSAARNVVMLPQGGYVDRGGTTRMNLLRYKLAAIALTAGMLSAPNGGTVANLLDGNPATAFTTGAVAGDPFVVVNIDLGAATNVCALDVTGFKAGTAARNDCVAAQYLDGAQWRNFCDPFHLRLSEARTRRFALRPEAGNVQARYLRLVVTGGSGPGTIAAESLQLWTETQTLTDTVVRSFNYEKGVSYQMAMAENGIDIFRDGLWHAAVPMPFTEAQLRRIKRETDYDTMLFFEQGLHSRRLVRAGSDREWNVSVIPFENLPRADYGGTYTNGVNEVQRVSVYGSSTADTFQLILEGNKTDDIEVAATWADTATNVKNALEALPGVDPGLTCTSPAGKKILVEFSGGDNAARDWTEMTGLASKTDMYVSVGTVTRGKEPGEDIMSDLRGWPAVGRFWQERLNMGGITARPNTFLASVTGEPFNLNTDLEGAISALSYDVSGEESHIRDIFVSGTMLLFLDAAVYHMQAAKLSGEEVPNVYRADAPGIEAHLSPLSLSNAIYYVQRGGQTINRLNYSELERNFIPDNASVLSAFLVDRPTDWTLRRATTGNDADLLFYINQDGTLVTLTLMQTQEVSGFAPHATEGKFVSLCTDGEQTIWLVCQRNVAGLDRMVLERMDPDLQLDSATEFAFDLPVSELAGLGAYEGQTVYAIADGQPMGPFIVAGASIQLPVRVSTARVGSWTAPFATDTPFYPEEANERPMARLKRVFGVDVSVAGTTSVAVAANGNDPVAAVINQPMTGTIVMEGFPGFTAGATITITQTRPGRLLVRSVKKRIAA